MSSQLRTPVPKLNWPATTTTSTTGTSAPPYPTAMSTTRKTRSGAASSSSSKSADNMKFKFYQPKPKKNVTLSDALMESELIGAGGGGGVQLQQSEGSASAAGQQQHQPQHSQDVMNLDEDEHEREEDEEFEDAEEDPDADAEAADTTMVDDNDDVDDEDGNAVVSASATPGPHSADNNNSAYNFPTSLFPDRKSCLAAANEVAQSHGFALSTHKSSQKRAVVICSRGGMPNARGPDEVVLRRTKSLKCDCPFRIAIRSKVTYAQNPATGEKIKGTGHYISVENPNHNHPLLEGAELAAIPKMRRLTKEQMEFVRNLEKEGKPPPQIFNMLKFKWPDCLANSKDVRNAINKIHRESTNTATGEHPATTSADDSVTPLQAFVNELTATAVGGPTDSPVAAAPAAATTADTAVPATASASTTKAASNTPTVGRWRLGKRPLENGTPTDQPAVSRPRLAGGSSISSTTTFPTVESLPAPSELFRRQMPYILTVHGDLSPQRNSIKVTCSHEPTLDLIAKYVQSHARVSKNSDTPVVKVELIPSFLNAGQDGGTLYDGLVIKPTMAGAPLNPATVVAFVEGVLKYTCVGVGTKDMFWQFKREVPAE